MPATQRSTGGARARAGRERGQATISFSGRVTKSVARDTKKTAVTPAVAQVAELSRPGPIKEDTIDGVDAEESVVTDFVEVEPQDEAPKRSEAEFKAGKISQTQINKYWRSVESQRKAPRVHQEGLEANQKVLRYFDVSSQYGPCIGVSRLRRWQRADRLGLGPPIEVLAALLKEEKGTKQIETAHMDDILNAIAVSA